MAEQLTTVAGAPALPTTPDLVQPAAVDLATLDEGQLLAYAQANPGQEAAVLSYLIALKQKAADATTTPPQPVAAAVNTTAVTSEGAVNVNAATATTPLVDGQSALAAALAGSEGSAAVGATLPPIVTQEIADKLAGHEHGHLTHHHGHHTKTLAQKNAVPKTLAV